MPRRRILHKDWTTPLTIPPGTCGNYAVEKFTIKAGDKVMFNSYRNALLGQQKGRGHLAYDQDTHWHRLTGPTGTWMTDLPVEQRQMTECLKGMQGSVLVGGLGLGLAAWLLAHNRTITKVDVVEISPEVIELVQPHLLAQVVRLQAQVTVIRSDLLTYLQEYHDKPYTHSFFDIWQSDSEHTFFRTVCPLLQTSQGKIRNRPVCWNEDVMRGQLLHSLQGRLFYLSADAAKAFPEQNKLLLEHPPWEPGDDIWTQWAAPFFQWWKDKQPGQDAALRMAQQYAALYGTWNWPTLWHLLTTGELPCRT